MPGAEDVESRPKTVAGGGNPHKEPEALPGAEDVESRLYGRCRQSAQRVGVKFPFKLHLGNEQQKFIRMTVLTLEMTFRY